MKKILVSILIVCCFVTVMNAQFFMGSTLSINYTQNNNDGNRQNSTIGFGIMPDLGYALNDGWDIGLAVGFGVKNYKVEIPTSILEVEGTNKTMGWMIAPYARYSFLQFGKLEMLAKTQLYIAGYTDKLYPAVGNEMTNSNNLAYGLNISPIILYNINNRMSLHAQLNFFSLDLGFISEKESKSDTFNVELGMDSNNLFNTGALTIGFTCNL